MNRNIDELLKQALSPVEEPGVRLNERTLKKAEEMEHMKSKKGKIGRLPMAAAIGAAVFVLGSGTAFAAWKYLTPAQVAQENGMEKLAAAFEGDDAVLINEKQTVGGYEITLLGVASGKDLSECVQESEIEENKTYVVTAVEKTDGSPMPEVSEETYGEEPFFMSPLIQGLDPNWYNAVTMGGGYGEFAQDGIMYRLVECDNVEIFADRGLYFCVNSGTFYDQTAYIYDAATGEIIRNEDYDGVNALFVLPIDPAKGNREEAEAYLKEWENSWEEDEEVPEISMDVQKFMDDLTSENLDTYAERVESTVQVVTPDREGEFSYSYDLDKGTEGISASGVESVENLFPDQKCNVPVIGGYSDNGSLEGLLIDVFTLNEDGTVTYAVYVPKKKAE